MEDFDSSMHLSLYSSEFDISTTFNLNVTPNTTTTFAPLPTPEHHDLKWGVLALSGLIAATMLGNVLVCLAVCWESRLQNMTNYFLMSLAIADLLVAMLVMPVGMVIELYGRFPFSPSLCVLYIASDVLMCTASIWHMCTMSMDRFFTLKYPMKYGRNKTKNMVMIKITFVWVVSLSICSPIVIMGFNNFDQVLVDGICAPRNPAFIIYGSVLAFYVPLTIMVVTYILTTRILHNNQKLMEEISRQHTQMQQVRSKQQQNGGQQNGGGGITQSLYTNMPFLSPNTSYMRFYRPVSCDPTSDIENITYDGLSDELRLEQYEYENNGSADTPDYAKYVPTENGHIDNGGLEFVAKELGSDERDQLLEVSKPHNGDSRRSSLLSSLSASQPNLAAKAKKSAGEKFIDELSRSQSFREPHVTSGKRITNSSKDSPRNPKHSEHKMLALPKQSPRRNFRSQPDLSETRHLSLRGSGSQHSLALPRHMSSRKGRMTSSQRQLTSSQSHLTSQMISRGHAASNPHLARSMSRSALRYSSIKSITSVFDLESVKAFDSISNASSVNSIMSREHTMSVWDDFEKPVMLSKLTKIEAEMDLCLMENTDPNAQTNQTERSRKSSQITDDPSSVLNTNNCHESRNSSIVSASINIEIAESQSVNSLASCTLPQEEVINNKTPVDSFCPIPSRQDEELLFATKHPNNIRPHIIPPVCISSPSPINSRSSQASHSDLERDSSFKSQSTYSGKDFDRDASFKSQSSTGMAIPSKQLNPETAEVHKSITEKDELMIETTLLPTPEVQITTYKSNGTITVNGYIECREKRNGSQSSLDSTENSNKVANNLTDDGITSDECLSETVSQMTQSTFTPFRVTPTPRHVANGAVSHKRRFTAPVWKTLSKTRAKLRSSTNGYAYHNKKNIISKKTATNERKASKVLGIIFAVFVILWTPFFIVNILTSVCSSCNALVPPELFTSLTWLGYVSSLMNPIIYTMFNTAFRKAFQKILTCQYPVCCQGKRKRAYAHAQMSKRGCVQNGAILSQNRRMSATTIRRTNSALNTNTIINQDTYNRR